MSVEKGVYFIFTIYPSAGVAYQVVGYNDAAHLLEETGLTYGGKEIELTTEIHLKKTFKKLRTLNIFYLGASLLPFQ